MKLKQTILLGIASLGIGAGAVGVSSIALAKSQPVSTPRTTAQANENKTYVCSNASKTFNQNESSILATEYSKTGTADCMTVGCGGVF